MQSNENPGSKALPPRWRRATAWTLLATTLTACAAGDLPDGDQGSSERAAPVTAAAAALSELPRAEAPATATLSATLVDGTAYAAAAAQVDDVKLDILAGVMVELAKSPPEGTPQQRRAHYEAALGRLLTLLRLDVPMPEADATTRHQSVGRLLAQLVPTLGAGAAEDAVRAYARTYLAQGRSTNTVAGVQPFKAPYDQDQFSTRFQNEIWLALHAAARADLGLAEAVDGGVFATRLQVRTDDDAQAILTRYPVEPLRSFILDKAVAADGSRTYSRAEIGAMVTATGSAGKHASDQYLSTLGAIDDAERAYVDKLEGQASRPAPPPTDADLQQLKLAVEAAKAKQTEYAGTLDKTEKVLGPAFKLLEKMGELGGAPEFARDMAKLGKAVTVVVKTLKDYMNKAIEGAEAISKFMELGATGFKFVAGAIMTGGAVAAVMAALEIFGGGSNPNQQVLDEIRKLQRTVEQMREEMHARFDRIDKALNLIFDEMVSQFRLVNFQLGVLQADVEVVQAALTELQDDLNRLDRNLLEFLQVGFKRPLLETINGTLNYALIHLGQTLPPAEFGRAENLFHSFATVHARDSLEAGTQVRDFRLDQLADELDHPLHFNINYLKDAPQALFGLPRLSVHERLANPYTWIVSGESYAQLFEENPTLAATIQIHPGEVILEGQKIASALDAIASEPLINQLANLYESAFVPLEQALAVHLASFHANPERSLKGTSIFGGVGQIPNDTILKADSPLPHCTSGKKFGPPDRVSDTLPFKFDRFDVSQLRVFELARSLSDTSNQGLSPLGLAFNACIAPRWTLLSSEPPRNNRRRETWRLDATVNVLFKAAGASQSAPLFRYQITTNRTEIVFVRIDEPDATGLPRPELVLPDVWSQIYTPGWIAQTSLVNPTQLASLITAITGRYDHFQAQFYATAATALGTSGDPANLAAKGITGAKRLFEAFAVMGFPISSEQNDVVRGLLFGSAAVLTGTDVGASDDFLNDVRGIYRHFSRPETDRPDANLIHSVKALAFERSRKLRDTLQQIRARLVASGMLEGRELVSRTLLRLRLLRQP